MISSLLEFSSSRFHQQKLYFPISIFVKNRFQNSSRLRQTSSRYFFITPHLYLLCLNIFITFAFTHLFSLSSLMWWVFLQHFCSCLCKSRVIKDWSKTLFLCSENDINAKNASIHSLLSNTLLSVNLNLPANQGFDLVLFIIFILIALLLHIHNSFLEIHSM